MSNSEEYLFVPIEVKALVVNDKTRYGQNFQRWGMNYQGLESYVSPVPAPFSGNTAWRDDPKANGVYLHWTLPEALRKGVQDHKTSKTEFPMVPNRWIIIRYSGAKDGRKAAAWIVESDFLDPNQGTSPYIDPFSRTLRVTNIGRKVELSSWSEGGKQELFLTVVGPADVTFASYQPYVENVFSIHDPLTGVGEKNTLSYLVAGWYSDSSKDILTSRDSSDNFADWLMSLQWQVAGQDNGKTAHKSIYHGLVNGIQWDKFGSIPASARPSDLSTVSLAVGNTSIDALTALIDQQANAQGSSGTIDAQLLEAFQYNLLPKLDEPNGKELLYQAIHKAWFGAAAGGYEWIIVKKPQEQSQQAFPSQPADWDERDLQPNWLADLNQDQAKYDEALRELQVLQWRLYSMWWTKGRFDKLPPGQQKALQGQSNKYKDDNFNTELDPDKEGHLAHQVQQQIRTVNQLLQNIPHGETQEELEQSILQFAAFHNLSQACELKRVAKESFYEANNPVVLIAGAKAADVLTADQPLTCRFKDELVTGFKFNNTDITTDSMKGKIPTVDLAKVPGVVPDLLNEFFFLDPNNAYLAASAALGTTDAGTIKKVTQTMAGHQSDIGQVPGLELKEWAQPWAPLFLVWEVQYYPISHSTNGKENWEFDGSKYNWTGNGAASSPLSLSGRIFLTPQSSFNFKRRLDDYRQKHPDLDPDALKNLEDFITQTDDWDFLSQSLDGFTQQLALRDIDSNVTPGDTELNNIIGNNNSIVPQLGNTPQPFKGWPASDFQQSRSGQFAFRRLMVVDRFGQSIEVVNSQTSLQFKPIISPDMKPTKTVLAQEPYRFVELSPRLLHPGRLSFDFVSAADDSKIINLHTNVNPICAWILPNHLDKALSCYDNAGNMLGELRVITDSQGKKVVQWEKGPNSDYTLDKITSDFLHLGQFINALIQKGPQAYSDFYRVVDETLWVIDPLGARDDQNLSVLIGRPLALVRARLQFQLDGPPIWDPSWQFVFELQPPGFIDYEFPIRLGELVLRNDGLIGYFFGNNYDQFNAVHMPITPTDPAYVKKIAPGNFIPLKFQDSSEAFVTMLMDPRAAVHATTVILPTTILNLPPRYVNPALTNMNITFHTGPLLADVEVKAAGGDNDTTIFIPVPAEKNGKWSWLSLEGQNWKTYPIQTTDDGAHFSNIPPVLRTGFLELAKAIKKGES